MGILKDLDKLEKIIDHFRANFYCLDLKYKNQILTDLEDQCIKLIGTISLITRENNVSVNR